MNIDSSHKALALIQTLLISIEEVFGIFMEEVDIDSPVCDQIKTAFFDVDNIKFNLTVCNNIGCHIPFSATSCNLSVLQIAERIENNTREFAF